MLKIYDGVESHRFTKIDDVLIGIDVEYTKTCDLGEVIWKTLSSKPSHVSQIDGYSGQSTTFAEMTDRSVRCALWLQKMGFGSGDIITYCTDNHLDTYIPIFATFYIGAIYNAWDHEVDLKMAQRLMRLIRPKAIFVIEATVEVLMEAARLENIDTQIVVFGKDSRWSSINEKTAEFDDEQVRAFRPVKIINPKQTASVTFTSGSTGFPKGIVHSYENLIKSVQLRSPYAAKDVALWFATPYWITSTVYALQCLLTYGTRIIAKRSNTEHVCHLIGRYKINRVFTNPNVAIAIQDYIKKYDFRALQLMFIIGSKIPAEGLKRLKSMLPNTQVSLAYGLCELNRSCACETDRTKCVGSVGFVSPSCQLKIVDTETEKTLGANQQGEIYVKAETIMLGYYNAGPTGLAIDREGWLHTGDLGYYDENCEIFVVDRIKEIAKVFEVQVSPVEIEEHLLSHPDVAEVAVVFVPNIARNNHAVAFAKRRFGADVTKEDLIEFSSTLGKYKKLWGGVAFVNEIPKTPTGKINRFVLKKEALRIYSEN